MKISPKKRFYHGSPVKILAFDTKFLNDGDDALGSGFYFTDNISDALQYAGYEEKNPIKGLVMEPTLHTVLLDVKNPLVKDTIGILTQAQVKAILRHLPQEALEDGLNNYGDVGTHGVERVLNDAAKIVAGEVNLSRRLFDLTNDMFDEHIDLFNRAVKNVLGYDGLAIRQKGITHVCAWFPEQITIIKHTPAKDVVIDDELSLG